MRFAPFLAASLTATFLFAAPAQARWQKLDGDAYRIDLPRHVLDGPRRETQAGTVVSSRDGAIELTVFDWRNRDRTSLRGVARDLRAELRDERRITYERIARRFMVQSGYFRDDDADGVRTIFYERTEPTRDGRGFVTMRLTYPESERGRVDRAIARMGRSLQATR